ncbi:hypothetical protein [Photobacterium damselae]|uniref:hypothetical protein n=1 Tax=Photobacterium damselae TaxID=38293 RepID=UPI0010FE01EF|nr:hypothetical protein [Photobacterium damselae]MCG3816106.1 hypothetical protein [Photobacterium damselae]TLS78534.1 hypothetical protein FD721_09865 [Photobacterium damselae subsp. damselae]TLS89949.1 hypothetical protein FD720_00740 [Photobacterium damselae subsp. damselae]
MKIILLFIILFGAKCFASSEIRSANNATCEQSDFQPWEIQAGVGRGVYDQVDINNGIINGDEANDTEFGFKLSYRFGGAKSIDCTKFQQLVEREQEAYTKQLELKIKQLENQLTKKEHIELNRVKFR